MPNGLLKSMMVFTALGCLSVPSFATAPDSKKPGEADKSSEKKKGEALKQLEGAAGKKIEDVPVPAVPKPTPVKRK